MVAKTASKNGILNRHRDALRKETITEVASKFWAPFSKTHAPYSAPLVDTIYQHEMIDTHFNPRKIIMLEFSQYLECYLWPNYTEQASIPHVMSIVVMLNEKFRERIDAWQCFVKKPEHFPGFIHRVLELSLDENSRSNAEQCAIITFLVNSFNSVEVDIVREQMNKLTHISIWTNLLPSQREDIFAGSKKLRKYWTNLSNKIAAQDAEDTEESRKARFERNYLWNLIARFKRTLDRVDDESKEVDLEEIRYCERFIELVTDLEALLPTRRFFNAVLHSSKLITHCVLSKLISSEAGSLFCQLVEMLKFYARFEINDITGQQLTHKEVSDRHYEHVVKLQKAAFKFFRESMPDFYLLNVGSVDTRKALMKQFGSMKKSDIYRFAEYLHLVPPIDSEESILDKCSKEFLTETITLHCERRVNQLQQLNEQPLYPTEQVIWDENVVPYENYSGEDEIRQDLEDVLFRMKPWRHESRNETIWGGWARMALLLDSFQIVEYKWWRRRHKKTASSIVTVDALRKETITEVASKFWAPFSKTHAPYSAPLVDTIYQHEMIDTHFNPRKIIMLEFSQYLECYLWPNYTEQASIPHVMSIVVMLNEKFRERIDAWQCFVKKPEHFPGFIHRVLELSLDENSRSNAEQCAIITFLVNSFNSVEVDIVREQMNKLTHISIWTNLLPSQREDIFAGSKKLRKYWTNLSNKIAAQDAEDTEESRKARFERNYLWNLIARFKRTLDRVDDESKEVDLEEIRYCERFIELVTDLEALLPTRRFFNAVLHSSKLITHCVLSKLISSEAGSLFCQLVEMLKFYARFEINDITGQQLTHKEVSDRHYEHVVKLQKAAFKFFRESMPDFYLLNVGSVDTRKALMKQFGSMKKSDIYRFAEYLHLVPPIDSEESILDKCSKEFLTETITLHCERRVNQLQQLNEQPLYPTEQVIWDENVVPYENYSGEDEIRQDLEDVLFRMKPWRHESRNETIWGGWARMALLLDSFQIVEVGKPFVGDKSPSIVKGEFAVNVGRRTDIKQEWENLRKHDVCFLVTCRSTQPVGTKYDVRKPFKDQIQVTYVRGCEIEGMMDQNGQVIEEFEAYEKRPQIQGDIRRYRVFLDPNQYRIDMENRVEKGAEDVYYTFNLVVRRDPKTNNFKAVLATMRQLLNTECVVPDWLTDIVLGYGEPDSAHYSKMSNVVPSLDFNDTFLSFEHLKESFPDYRIEATAEDGKMVPPFQLTFKDLIRKGGKEGEKAIEVTPLIREAQTPYVSYPNRNQVRFTPAQIEAIKAGMQPGLTMVVGPPGTGKTDVAVQIIANIYHNWPQQRTLIVTHSNQALNQLFEKIIALDVDERHLLRMGHGEEGLETEKDFSRYGRVNHVLKERLRLLSEVERLQHAMNVIGDVSYTCENAGHFFRFTVCRAWDDFMEKCAIEKDGLVAEIFPFTGYFSDINPLFSGSFKTDMEVARSCWRHINHIFEQLEEFRAFELLRNGRDRTEYLLVKEAKIIAMTCTHAALRRNELVQLGFRYDNILMEEAAQILEVETFIPLLLQNPQDGRNRLKRWCMIGDHHQLPPVVQNQAFQKYSNMEQSLFARFVPTRSS
ncbi:hypothetical protein OSTOST_10532 [Ostertagia ostertagi]